MECPLGLGESEIGRQQRARACLISWVRFDCEPLMAFVRRLDFRFRWVALSAGVGPQRLGRWLEGDRSPHV